MPYLDSMWSLFLRTLLLFTAALAGAEAQVHKVKTYSVSVAKTERVKEWKDPIGGIYAATVRAPEGQEILLVTLRVEGAGKVVLGNLVAHAAGKVYPSVFKSIEEIRFDTSGKESSAVFTFERPVPFVVPAGVSVDRLTIDGIDLPMPATTPAALSISGRLVDVDGKPVARADTRPCRQMREADGSLTTFFAMYTDGTWAVARTDDDGRFVFDKPLALGRYCLDVQVRMGRATVKTSSGDTFQFEVREKTGSVDLGSVIVVFVR